MTTINYNYYYTFNKGLVFNQTDYIKLLYL